MNDAASRMRLRVLEANREAARLYHALLYAPEGKAGLDYYHSRGYTDATIRHFGLGYAPDSFDFLRDSLQKKGISRRGTDGCLAVRPGPEQSEPSL